MSCLAVEGVTQPVGVVPGVDPLKGGPPGPHGDQGAMSSGLWRVFGLSRDEPRIPLYYVVVVESRLARFAEERSLPGDPGTSLRKSLEKRGWEGGPAQLTLTPVRTTSEVQLWGGPAAVCTRASRARSRIRARTGAGGPDHGTAQ